MASRGALTLTGVAAGVLFACASVVPLAPVAAAPLPAAARHWHIVASPNPSDGFKVLQGIDCPTTTRCVAVGTAAGTLIEMWDGTRWRIVPSPNPPNDEGTLFNVTCVDASHCVAVGRYGRPVPKTFFLAWNGRRWSVQPTPSLGVDQVDVYGVACPRVDRCFAVGFYSVGAPDHIDSLIERWDGAHWSVVPSPNPVSYDNELHDVSCLTPSNCVAVGNADGSTLVMRWNGARWSVQPSPTPNTFGGAALYAVSCTSAASCMAVGERGTGDPYRSFAMRWNGSRWSIVASPTPKSGGSLDDVDCSAASDCTVVGSDHTGTARTVIEHWNGTGWSVEPSPNSPGHPSSVLSGVACVSARACFATGVAFDPGTSATLVEHSS